MQTLNATSGVIFNIKGFALHDGPGIRTTVFFKGCPLRCWWCHNPEGQQPEPEPMQAPRHSSGTAAGPWPTIGRRASVAEVLSAVEKDLIFYDESGGGVTFSGGEPLAQIDFLEALLDACGGAEIHTALDTTGYAPPRHVSRIAEKVGLFLYDLKLLDEGQHIAYTGVSNRPVLENLALLAERRRPLRIRVPLVPGITDSAANLAQLAELAAGIESLECVDLLPYHRIGSAKWQRLGLDARLGQLAPPTQQQIEIAISRLAVCGKPIHIGG